MIKISKSLLYIRQNNFLPYAWEELSKMGKKQWNKYENF